MDPDRYPISVMDLLGPYSAILSLVAVLLGVTSLVFRTRKVNFAIAHALVGVSLAGIGTTAYRLYDGNSFFRFGAGIDPAAWLSEFGIAWMPAAIVLHASAIGFLLVGVSWLFTGHGRSDRI